MSESKPKKDSKLQEKIKLLTSENKKLKRNLITQTKKLEKTTCQYELLHTDHKKNRDDFDKLNKKIEDTPIVVGLRDIISQKDTEILRLRRSIGKDQEQLNTLIKNIERLKPYFSVYHPDKMISKPRPVTPVIQFGDWHIGEVVNKFETGGYNEYNYEIATNRIFTITDSIIKWVTLNRIVYNIDDAFILDLGDNISGDIHEELKTTNEFPVPEQIVKCAYLKAEVYRRLSAHFNNLNVVFVVPDNHSRKTKKPQFKQGGLNSENYLVGVLVKEMLANVKKINFHLEISHQAVVDIYSHRYICEHGNMIRSYMGFPWYGADRKVGREAKRLMHNGGFSKMVIQHFHVPMSAQYYNVGGSLSGTTELDHACGRHAEPSQCAWMVHPEHGQFNWCTFEGK